MVWESVGPQGRRQERPGLRLWTEPARDGASSTHLCCPPLSMAALGLISRFHGSGWRCPVWRQHVWGFGHCQLKPSGLGLDHHPGNGSKGVLLSADIEPLRIMSGAKDTLVPVRLVRGQGRRQSARGTPPWGPCVRTLQTLEQMPSSKTWGWGAKKGHSCFSHRVLV